MIWTISYGAYEPYDKMIMSHAIWAISYDANTAIIYFGLKKSYFDRLPEQNISKISHFLVFAQMDFLRRSSVFTDIFLFLFSMNDTFKTARNTNMHKIISLEN